MRTPSWSELSVAEAERLLLDYQAQIAPLSDRFRRRAAEADQAERLAAGLERLDEIVWPIVRALRPGPTEVEQLLADPRTPIWARYTHGIAARIGIDCSLLVAELAAFCTVLVENRASSLEWAVDLDRSSADLNRPVMVVDGRRSAYLDDQIAVLVAQFVRGDQVAQEPERIRRAVESRLPGGQEGASTQGSPVEPTILSVTAEAPGQAWSHVIEIDDVVAHQREDDVADLVRELRQRADVELVIHSDREIILVATALPAERVHKIAMGLLDRLPRAGD